MSKRISSMIRYMQWLIALQKESQNHSIFRIVNISENKIGKKTLHIQIANKTTTMQCHPEDIVADDTFLNGFSRQDVRTITYLATQEIHRPKKEIISHRFTDNFKKIIFKIFNRNTNTTEEKTTPSLLSENMINDFGQKDAYRIGYMAAMEQSIQENALISTTDENKP